MWTGVDLKRLAATQRKHKLNSWSIAAPRHALCTHLIKLLFHWNLNNWKQNSNRRGCFGTENPKERRRAFDVFVIVTLFFFFVYFGVAFVSLLSFSFHSFNQHVRVLTTSIFQWQHHKSCNGWNGSFPKPNERHRNISWKYVHMTHFICVHLRSTFRLTSNKCVPAGRRRM